MKNWKKTCISAIFQCGLWYTMEQFYWALRDLNFSPKKLAKRKWELRKGPFPALLKGAKGKVC